MRSHLAKILVLTLLSLSVLFGKSIFASNLATQAILYLTNNIVQIIYTPPSYTSGDVLANLTGSDITGNLQYLITDNGTYTFSYLRGTGPYTPGMPYGPTNLRNTLFVTGTVYRIDRIPPTFELVFAPDGQSAMIWYTDNIPGATATVNGLPYISGSPLYAGVYDFVVRDLAGNSTGMIFSINMPICGNGVQEGDEFCDDGPNNGTAGYCNTSCNGIVAHVGGGGGGTIGLVQDHCPGGDFSPSYYDNSCGTPPGEGHGSAPEPAYEEELTMAYNRAFNLGITTMAPISKANLTGYLLRKHLAKMISVFTLQTSNIRPDLDKVCSFPDIQKESAEMQHYAILSCQLGLMGLEENGITPKASFDPNMLVTRAQFGTVLSRLLFGGTYNIQEGERTYSIANNSGIISFVAPARPQGSLLRYSKHLEALNKYHIMKKIDNPMMLELRGRVMLMLMRSEIAGILKERLSLQMPGSKG